MESKTCTLCGKSDVKFRKHRRSCNICEANKQRERNQKDPDKYRSIYRKSAEKHKEKRLAQQQKHREDNPNIWIERNKRYKLLKFGLPETWWEDQMERQKHKCPIGSHKFTKENRPVLHHNHNHGHAVCIICNEHNWIEGKILKHFGKDGAKDIYEFMKWEELFNP